MKKSLTLALFLSTGFIFGQPSLVEVDHTNMRAYLNLAQAYEAEFSPLTKKLPNQQGIFALDTIPGDQFVGYLLFDEKTPIGFCVVDTKSEIHDIAEFYIIPLVRKQGFGKHLAFSVFDKFPGKWHVREIENANKAIAFWRKIINEYTDTNYCEEKIDDPYWGPVTRQEFQN